MDIYVEVILTLLTIITGVLAVLTFINTRKKEEKTDSEANGVMKQKIDDIDKRTESMQKDIREIRSGDTAVNKELAALHESTKSAHKRIDHLEEKLERIEFSRMGG